MNDIATSTRLIKIAKKVYRYDEAMFVCAGTHDVYYDRISNIFIIADFPHEGHEFEMTNEPPLGSATVEAGGERYDIRVFEKV